MALFGFKKEKKEKTEKPVIQKTDVVTPSSDVRQGQSSDAGLYNTVIVSPRITEKATLVAEMHGAHVFNVNPTATKQDIARAIERIYKVRPVSIRIVTLRGKKVFGRGKGGRTAGGKKAYVFLKKGDSIDTV